MKRTVLSIMLVILMIGVYAVFNDNSIDAVRGTLNLKNYNFQQNGNVKIKGQLELYNHKLLKPEELKYEKTHEYLTISKDLKSQLNGESMGYMTLHLKILANNDAIYGLRIQELLSASKVWVNGVLQGQVGKVGTSYEAEKAIYLPDYMYFKPENGVIDIVMQTSNYTDLTPSINPMEFGLKDKITNKLILNTSVDLIIVGALFIMEMLFSMLRKSLKSGKLCIYFCAICFLIQLRCLFLNERVIVHFFPNMPFELLSKTAALTYYFLIPAYVLFLKELFYNFPKRIIVTSVVSSTIFSIICLVTNNLFYDRLGFLSQANLFVIAVDLFIFLIRKVREKEKDSKLLLLAFTFLMGTALNDILLNNGAISSRYGFQVGMFIFAFLQAHVIMIEYSNEIINSEKIKLENKIMYEKSIRDNLTNLYNRNYIEEILDSSMERYVSDGEVFTVLMFDIDYFKAINDTYGHLQGDVVLSTVSSILVESVRNSDYVGRYGGEEFIVILKNTKEEVAREIAERIRKNIKDFPWENGIKVTISGGLYENHTYEKKECIKNADDRLYEAKKNGRNQIVYSC
ncbi:diguanylate cyclase [Clostridium neuense]|uniref:Diguanylate cyclase n=1 Tax=Clostridium neuense TaxID=1728934 RepID=A0ABW8TEQ0_9CLOT